MAILRYEPDAAISQSRRALEYLRPDNSLGRPTMLCSLLLAVQILPGGTGRMDAVLADAEVGMDPLALRVGCAGWSIPAGQADSFAPGASHLARYATRFGAVEIDSSFYRPHRPSTYRRWAASVPVGFQFAVKAPRTITHERRLRDSADLLDAFLAECGELGEALGPVLLQLPPSLPLDAPTVGAFLKTLRDRFEGAVVCEPRHASWFSGEADALLASYSVARVTADPAVVPAAAEPGGWRGLAYYRLHGSPRVYYSDYAEATLAALAEKLLAAAQTGTAWCIFDNTAAGAATANALQLQRLLRSS